MKLPVFALSFLSAGALLLSSCEQRTTAPTAATPPPAAAPSVAAGEQVPETAADWEPDVNSTLTASPNPVPTDGGLGATTITWSTGGRPTAAVYVSTDGAAEALFAEGSEGSSEAPWIKAGPTYEFRMYSDTTRVELLAKLTLTASK